MNYFKNSAFIILAISISRFIPHPPNFTILIALSFYAPIFLGVKYIPIVLVSFAFTDLVLGFHKLTLFTWGSILLIGYFSKFFSNKLFSRFTGLLVCCCLFFLISNFGVWLIGSHGVGRINLIETYVLAIPFFGNTILSSFIVAILIEAIFKYSSQLSKSKKII